MLLFEIVVREGRLQLGETSDPSFIPVGMGPE